MLFDLLIFDNLVGLFSDSFPWQTGNRQILHAIATRFFCIYTHLYST